MQWTQTPDGDGWYWHRFHVGEVPVYNVCCIMSVDGRLFVHYLGDTSQRPFVKSETDKYWGPLKPPYN